ncbi:META domain-containing protein [Trinickia sp. LjRoot230]|uniref:META domain-containing protein n=1 Tax=Trinickia sp. LjRoot230 TaxID=3342288 RepID=UPI003ECD17E2
MWSQFIASLRAATRASGSRRAGVLASAALLAACAMPTHPDSAAPRSDPFVPAAVQLLDDTHWVLAAWQTADGGRRELPSEGDAARPTLDFSTATGQRQASGIAGCNRFSARYSLIDGTLSFGPLTTTRRACPGERGEFERGYLDALAHIGKTGVQWRPPVQLVIITEDGATLSFQRADR